MHGSCHIRSVEIDAEYWNGCWILKISAEEKIRSEKSTNHSFVEGRITPLPHESNSYLQNRSILLKFEDFELGHVDSKKVPQNEKFGHIFFSADKLKRKQKFDGNFNKWHDPKCSNIFMHKKSRYQFFVAMA